MKTLPCLLAGLLLAVALSLQAQTPSLPTFTPILDDPFGTDYEPSMDFAWGDYDDDGFLDLFVVNNVVYHGLVVLLSYNSLYHNNRNGTFTKITAAAPVTTEGSSLSACWADYDNDGRLDLFVTQSDLSRAQKVNLANQLYRNMGNGEFALMTADQVGDIAGDKRRFTYAGWADYNQDGYLDLFATTDAGQTKCLYRSNGGTNFTRMTAQEVGPLVSDTSHGNSISWADYDNDSHPDLFVHHYINNAPEALWRNDGTGKFQKVTQGSVNQIANGASTWGDYDNDGFLELFTAHYAGRNLLHHSFGGHTFTNIAASAGLNQAMKSSAGAWGDFDNDGYLDLFVVNFQSTNALFHNNGNGTFTSVDAGSPLVDGGDHFAAGWADYDNDGFLDLYIGNGGGAATAELNLLYHNEGNNNRWLKAKLRGTISNRSGIGAKVRILATIGNQTLWQMREISGGSAAVGGQGLIAHFGLGDATNVDIVRIEWPSGIVQELRNIAPQQSLTITEPARLQVMREDTFRIQSWMGMVFEVQASSDLMQWSPVATVTNMTGTLDYSAATTKPLTPRYYRVMSR
jgi:hypothetical protein